MRLDQITLNQRHLSFSADKIMKFIEIFYDWSRKTAKIYFVFLRAILNGSKGIQKDRANTSPFYILL